MKRNAAVMLLLLVLVTACVGTGFSLPPVAGVSGGERLPGKVIWQDLLTDTPQQTEAFYGGLFGWEFEPLGGGVNYTLIRHRGHLIGGLVDQNRLPATADISQWVVAMSVADIGEAVQTVADAGGEVFTPATSLGERGDIAVVADPTGALLALLQTRDGDPVDANADPATGDFLWRELWTVEVDRAARFLTRLAPFAVESIEIDAADKSVAYRLLKTADLPRAGVRTTPVPQMPPMWVSYLRVADQTELAAILAKVPGLGGEILVPALARPGGGYVAVIAGPSGAGIALQTWPLALAEQAEGEEQ